MVDLKDQYNDIKKEINEVITDTIVSATFINGPQVSFDNAKCIFKICSNQNKIKLKD